jgi:hypothetical protein
VKLVIDASVAVRVGYTRGLHALSRHRVGRAAAVVDRGRFRAPRPEYGAVSCGVISRTDAAAGIRGGDRARRAQVACDRFVGRGDELGWAKTYDANYVALARILDCRLVTLDARLRRGTARLGFVIGPTEL